MRTSSDIMTFRDDPALAGNRTPATGVALTIVDGGPLPFTAPEAVNNVKGARSFHVLVANNGRLKMTRVCLHIEGLNGTQVSMAPAGPWSNAVLPPAMAAVNVHSSQPSVNFYYKAPDMPQPVGVPLVRAEIIRFDAKPNDD